MYMELSQSNSCISGWLHVHLQCLHVVQDTHECQAWGPSRCMNCSLQGWVLAAGASNKLIANKAS